MCEVVPFPTFSYKCNEKLKGRNVFQLGRQSTNTICLNMVFDVSMATAVCVVVPFPTFFKNKSNEKGPAKKKECYPFRKTEH